MPLHDVYARLTPYEIAFPGRRFVESRFAEIAGEGPKLGVDLEDPGAFAMLPKTGEMISEIMADGLEPGGSTQTGALVFHGFHFWQEREALFLASEGFARSIVARAQEGQDQGETAPGGLSAELPPRAGYLQLPRHLFWSRAASDEGLPEPVDGFFWSLSKDAALSILLIVGMRGGRDGFGAVHLPAVSREESTLALTEPGREDLPDFDPTGLPGAEIESLLGIETAVEAVKLVLGTLGALRSADAPVRGKGSASTEPAGEEAGAATSEPAPTSLSWRRVSDDGA